jgi:hypothetical protein
MLPVPARAATREGATAREQERTREKRNGPLLAKKTLHLLRESRERIRPVLVEEPCQSCCAWWRMKGRKVYRNRPIDGQKRELITYRSFEIVIMSGKLRWPGA